jgi:hypothetical protein
MRKEEERRAKEEADKIKKEEERKAKEEERMRKEEEKKAKEEADRIKKEEERKAKEEAMEAERKRIIDETLRATEVRKERRNALREAFKLHNLTLTLT